LLSIIGIASIPRYRYTGDACNHVDDYLFCKHTSILLHFKFTVSNAPVINNNYDDKTISGILIEYQDVFYLGELKTPNAQRGNRQVGMMKQG